MNHIYDENNGLFNHQETLYYLGSDTTGDEDSEDEYYEWCKLKCTFEELWEQEHIDF